MAIYYGPPDWARRNVMAAIRYWKSIRERVDYIRWNYDWTFRIYLMPTEHRSIFP